MPLTSRRALRVVVPAAGVAAALTLAGCAGGGAPASTGGDISGATLTVWNSIDFDPYQTLQKGYFEQCAKDLGVTVNVETVTGDYTSKLLQAASSKTLPDIALLSTDTQVPTLASQGVLANLGDLGVSTDGISDKVASLGKYDGSLYALPVQVENYVLFYDTAAFAAAGITAPPKTFDELVTDAKTLATNGRYGIALPGVSGDGSTATYFLPFLLSAGGDPAKPTSAEAATAVDLYKQLVSTGGLSKEFVNWGWDVSQQWTGQKAVIQLSGPWNLVDSSIPFPIGTVPIPTAKAGGTSVGNLLGYAYGVSAAGDQKQQRAAAALVTCRASEANQLETALKGGYIPARTAAQDAFIEKVPAAKPFVDAIPAGYNAASLGTEWKSLQQVYVNAIQDATVNGTSAAEALKKAAAAQ